MARPFPQENPYLKGRFAPLTFEADAYDLPVTGKLPEGLVGTLYRNGPNPQHAPIGRYHWFAGDGMLHAFRFEGGRVGYRNRWMRTPKWQLERKLGTALDHRDLRLSALDSTLANTNVVWYAGELLALEEAHAPFAVDPVTLGPRGAFDFWGRVKGPVTAHPKFDPRTGELVFFGYSTSGPFSPDVHLGVAGASGQLTRSEMIVLPFASMVHDFAITQRWIVLPMFPLVGSMERLASGGPAYAWEPERGTRVLLVSRESKNSVVLPFEGPPCFVFHFLNAFDASDGRVIVDGMKYPRASLFPAADGAEPTEEAATLVRWSFDPASPGHGWDEERIDDRSGEFPRLDERFASLDYRHGYFRADSAEKAGGTGIAHVDLHTRRVVEWQPGGGDYAEEPVFVPRSPGAPEGNGWLLSTVYRGAAKCSDLAVIDARDVAAGPIALVHLSHHVPAGFHGNWRAGAH